MAMLKIRGSKEGLFLVINKRFLIYKLSTLSTVTSCSLNKLDIKNQLGALRHYSPGLVLDVLLFTNHHKHLSLFEDCKGTLAYI